MRDVLTVSRYTFPYTDVKFSGMNTGERILFVTRESAVVYYARLGILVLVAIFIFVVGAILISFLQSITMFAVALWLMLGGIVAAFAVGGWWWIHETYRKSVFIITTRRLTKIIHTSPFTWYQFSLGLDEIQDTGSYGASYLEAVFRLGYFVARSGAAAIKNFKIVNITFAQDLHNYVNKLLYTFKHHPDKIDHFRPFIPHLKGEHRAKFLKKYPEYKTEFEH